MEKKLELVFIPTPEMGHLLSMVEIAKLIVERDNLISVVILIINVSSDVSAVNTYVDSKSRDPDLIGRLTFVQLPALSNPPAMGSRNTLIELYKPHVKQTVLDWVQAGSPKPAGFILDLFCATMIDVANELHVPTYFFFTSGASLLNFMFRHQSMADNDGVNVLEEFNDPDKETYVPGFRNPVPGKVVPSSLLDKDGVEILLNITRRFRESNGILINTYVELESFSTQTLLEQADEGKVPPMYPVGPILELDSRGGDGSHNSTIEWLNNQPPSSVVFLCFGSRGSFNEEQVREIANGLESSGHRFLWSLRKPPPQGKPGIPSQHEIFVEALPEGFLERTAERGNVISWAAQVAILAHPAIGGFVSHCGWNSTLESLWLEVPMATWPLYAEQQLNAFELVKELGLAVEIRMDYRTDWKTQSANFVVTAEEIENGVKKLMSMDEKKREKVKEMGDKGRKALQNGGSSYNWLGRFLADVVDNVQ